MLDERKEVPSTEKMANLPTEAETASLVVPITGASSHILLDTQQNKKWLQRFTAFDDFWFVFCVVTVWYSVFTEGGLDNALGFAWFLANCPIWDTLSAISAAIKLPVFRENAKKSLLHPTIKSAIEWSIRIYAVLIFLPIAWATWSASRDFFKAPTWTDLIYSDKTFGDAIPLAMGNFAYSFALLLFDTLPATYSAIRAYQKYNAFKLFLDFTGKYEAPALITEPRAKRFVLCAKILYENHKENEWVNLELNERINLAFGAIVASEGVADNYQNIEQYLLAIQHHKFRAHTKDAVLFFLATLAAAAGGLSMLVYPKVFIAMSAALYTPAAFNKIIKLMSLCKRKAEIKNITTLETQTGLTSENVTAFFSSNQLRLIGSGLQPEPVMPSALPQAQNPTT